MSGVYGGDVTEAAAIGKTALVWAAPPRWPGALSGAVVVLGFTVVQNVFISDIWCNVSEPTATRSMTLGRSLPT